MILFSDGISRRSSGASFYKANESEASTTDDDYTPTAAAVLVDQLPQLAALPPQLADTSLVPTLDASRYSCLTRDFEASFLPMLARAGKEPLLVSLRDAWLSGLWLWLHANSVEGGGVSGGGGFLQLVFGFAPGQTLSKVNTFCAALASLPVNVNDHYAHLRVWRFGELPSEISFLVVALYRAFWRGRKALLARSRHNPFQRTSRIDSHYMGKSFRRLEAKLAERPLQDQFQIALDVMTHVEMLTIIGDATDQPAQF